MPGVARMLGVLGRTIHCSCRRPALSEMAGRLAACAHRCRSAGPRPDTLGRVCRAPVGQRGTRVGGRRRRRVRVRPHRRQTRSAPSDVLGGVRLHGGVDDRVAALPTVHRVVVGVVRHRPARAYPVGSSVSRGHTRAVDSPHREQRGPERDGGSGRGRHGGVVGGHDGACVDGRTLRVSRRGDRPAARGGRGSGGPARAAGGPARPLARAARCALAFDGRDLVAGRRCSGDRVGRRAAAGSARGGGSRGHRHHEYRCDAGVAAPARFSA